MVIRTSLTSDNDAKSPVEARVHEALAKAFPEAGFEQKSVDEIGSSVGGEMRKSALLAVTLALIGMIIYIALRFEFGFALGAVTALIADILICIGLYSLLGRQISLTVVAALLTIVGYAINDTIVVFDRVREDLGKDQRTPFKEVVNRALNRTLSRTFLTSFTTLFPVLTLVLFASGPIFDFALVMCFGIVFGTFGTLFIATPAMVAWYRGKRPGFEAAKRKII
jgi:preprotein translocase SecF subunit